MSATALKLLAVVCMLVDHAGVVFPLMGGVTGPESLWYYLPRYVGRLAFPIFVFFAAEGCRKTRSLPRYALRLGVMAAVSQIPFSLASKTLGGQHDAHPLSGGWRRCGSPGGSRSGGYGPGVCLVPLLCACAAALLTGSDYGAAGVLLLFALYLCGEDRRRQLRCLLAGLALIYLIYYPLIALLSQPILTSARLEVLLGFTLPQHVIFFLCAAASALLLQAYNGERGRGFKWFFYWFYPLHLLALWGLSLLILP